MQQPLIFDIKRYAINDGPGIRIVIFFKGCPLSCLWCHNPESIALQPQKLFTQNKCIGCGECVRVCPQQACQLTAAGIVTDPQRCDFAGRCAEVCPTLATEISGYHKTVPELLKIIETERTLFDQSGGGVTFSGGEPLLHPNYLSEILDQCGRNQIHRTVDTCGFVSQATLLEVSKRTDLFLYDLKLMDSDKHKAYTGVDNTLILSNLKALAKTGVDIQIRIPLIKGVNSDRENLTATAKFIASLAGEKKAISLLPYHATASHKYQKLGQSYLHDNLKEPDSTELETAIDCFLTHNLVATVGG
ncbi:pyruvate formate lyase activating enzyme [Desulfuromusa kysingii]|uniref:Pyruvate formate lyase activating enzyme n=1 Tax=Desulfuromusa kysingii TaxID=37625 RepID=A0A1H4CI46_9BACT|nr:glycyl-radical enzyme activating protein [Desulfuromusa kysingii]SEA59993.1 pyruvate formate lyase activating enzyme [Desulfuromusa kysingii]